MKKFTFSMKRKSGTIRKSCHGVKTKGHRGNKVYIDCPSVGSLCLFDDITEHIISFTTNGPDPYSYKIESYPARAY